MNRKVMIKYILIYIPFITGIGMYSFSIINLFSSLLFFVGGYIAIKNTLDYRTVKRNIDMSKIDNIYIDDDYNDKNNNIVCVRKMKRNIKVRKRVK